MLSKKERTTQYIIETAAPILNKHGFVGTSMSKIEDATGLTKGAIYANFKNKDTLAVEAFTFMVRKFIRPLSDKINEEPSALGKLKAITTHYRQYYDDSVSHGGCPLLNVGVDANHQHPQLLERVQRVIHKLKKSIVEMIFLGIEQGELRPDLDAKHYASRIFASIQGSIFLALTLRESHHINDMMDNLDQMILTEMKL